MSQTNQMNQQNQAEQEKAARRERKRDKFRAFMQDMGAKLSSMLLENWGSKLLALLIAIVLWAGLISQDETLTREKTFQDVAISVVGEDTLRRNGYIVLDDLNEVLDDVNLSVNVPQGQYTAAQASNYAVRIDLSRITSAGEQEVRILSSNSSTYGTVTRISPATVTLTVDEYITRYRIPVNVLTTGEPPAGFWADEPSSDPPVVAISGPRSLVDQVVGAVVTVDQTLLPDREGKVRSAAAFTLVDANGEVVDSKLLSVTGEGVLLDSVVVEQQVYPLREIPLNDVGLVKGVPAPGYEVKGVYITPGTLYVAGRGSVLNSLNMFYADGQVDVTGLTQSVSEAIRVRQTALAKYISTDTVNVAVEIGPVVVDRSWSYIPVMMRNLSAGLNVETSVSAVTFHALGAQNWLDSVGRSDLRVVCDMSTITAPGTYTLPLLCDIGGDDGQSYTCEAEPAAVTVTVTTREK